MRGSCSCRLTKKDRDGIESIIEDEEQMRSLAEISIGLTHGLERRPGQMPPTCARCRLLAAGERRRVPSASAPRAREDI
jgi:hypothetical protein